MKRAGIVRRGPRRAARGESRDIAAIVVLPSSPVPANDVRPKYRVTYSCFGTPEESGAVREKVAALLAAFLRRTYSEAARMPPNATRRANRGSYSR
jgi:hypothetical protein